MSPLMNPQNMDPLTAERIRMENIGRGFIIFIFGLVVLAGFYLL